MYFFFIKCEVECIIRILIFDCILSDNIKEKDFDLIKLVYLLFSIGVKFFGIGLIFGMMIN